MSQLQETKQKRTIKKYEQRTEETDLSKERERRERVRLRKEKEYFIVYNYITVNSEIYKFYKEL